MLKTFLRLILATFRNFNANTYVAEKRFFIILSILMLSSEAFRAFICSYLLAQFEELTFIYACLYLLSFIIFILAYVKYRKQNNNLRDFAKQNYVYAASIKSGFDAKSIFVSQKSNIIYIINSIKLFNIKYFELFKIFVLKNGFYQLGSNSYSKLNKNFKRYSEILKKYI